MGVGCDKRDGFKGKRVEERCKVVGNRVTWLEELLEGSEEGKEGYRGERGVIEEGAVIS